MCNWTIKNSSALRRIWDLRFFCSVSETFFAVLLLALHTSQSLSVRGYEEGPQHHLNALQCSINVSIRPSLFRGQKSSYCNYLNRTIVVLPQNRCVELLDRLPPTSNKQEKICCSTTYFSRIIQVTNKIF